MSLRIGIVGCGGIGRTHMQAWLAAGYQPVAVCDAIPAVAHTLAALSDATVYSDAATLFANAQLDVVSICTPPALHAEFAIAALDHRIAVLCEKPMAPTLAECDAMIAAATRNHTLLSVGFCHRYQPHIEVMKSQIAAGAIGEVIMFRNRFAGHMPNVETRWFSDPALAGGGVGAGGAYTHTHTHTRPVMATHPWTQSWSEPCPHPHPRPRPRPRPRPGGEA